MYIAEPKGHRLRFSASFRCASCSSALEADGPELVEEARRAFLAAEGRWSLHVHDLGPRPVETLRVLRAALPGTPSAIAKIVRERKPLVEGTLVELEGLELMLEEAGAGVGMTRLPD
ncbi:MAG TPA: hypothetical protein VGD80_36240 [Kofleriaceae bacterium]